MIVYPSMFKKTVIQMKQAAKRMKFERKKTVLIKLIYTSSACVLSIVKVVFIND